MVLHRIDMKPIYTAAYPLGKKLTDKEIRPIRALGLKITSTVRKNCMTVNDWLRENCDSDFKEGYNLYRILDNN